MKNLVENREKGPKLATKPPTKQEILRAPIGLLSNYFNGEGSKYDENDFKRCFRMHRAVFYQMYRAILGKGLFVQNKLNFSKKMASILLSI
jgi:hypothetical protein